MQNPKIRIKLLYHLPGGRHNWLNYDQFIEPPPTSVEIKLNVRGSVIGLDIYDIIGLLWLVQTRSWK
jgi:hypothetical protein